MVISTVHTLQSMNKVPLAKLAVSLGLAWYQEFCACFCIRWDKVLCQVRRQN